MDRKILDVTPLDGIADHNCTFLKSFKIVKDKFEPKFYGQTQLGEHFEDSFGQQSMFSLGDDFVLQADILRHSSRYENERFNLAFKLADIITSHNFIPGDYIHMYEFITPDFDFEVVFDRVTKLNSLCYMIDDIIKRGINDDKPNLPSNYVYMTYTIYLPSKELTTFQKDLHSYIKIAEALLQFEFDYVTYFWNKENFAIFFDWTLILLRNSDDDWKDKIIGESIDKELLLTAKFPMFFIKLSSEELTFIIDNLKNNPPIQNEELNFKVLQLKRWFDNLTKKRKRDNKN